jgi:hypothetical protein
LWHAEQEKRDVAAEEEEEEGHEHLRDKCKLKDRLAKAAIRNFSVKCCSAKSYEKRSKRVRE